MSLDQPRGVVAVDEAGHGLAELIDAVIRAQCIRAAALMDLGRRTEARKTLEKALRRAPSYVFGLLTMAQLMAVDNPERARALLQKAITIEPANRALHLEKGWLDIAVGNNNEALAKFDRLLEDHHTLKPFPDELRRCGCLVGSRKLLPPPNRP